MSDEVIAPAGDTPSAAAPSAPVGTPAPSGAAGTPPTPASASAGTRAAETAYTYKEDRSNWVPSHVVRTHTERIRAMERDLAIERSRVAALSGVQPPTPQDDPETAAIRQQFFKVFPWAEKIAKLNPEQIDRLVQFDPAPLTQTLEQVAVQHGAHVLQQLAMKVKDAYGGAELAPRAVARIQQLFINDLDADPELRARYERGDMGVIDDFVKEYTGGLLDPFRRSTQAVEQPRREAASRLPRGGAGSAIAAGTPPPTVKPSDGDEYHKAVFRRYRAATGGS